VNRPIVPLNVSDFPVVPLWPFTVRLRPFLCQPFSGLLLSRLTWGFSLERGRFADSQMGREKVFGARPYLYRPLPISFHNVAGLAAWAVDEAGDASVMEIEAESVPGSH
jgi:hypothetical protein